MYFGSYNTKREDSPMHAPAEQFLTLWCEIMLFVSLICHNGGCMARGLKKHLKTLNRPKHWMLDELGGEFLKTGVMEDFEAFRFVKFASNEVLPVVSC
ncbi:hypothetical protein C5167_021532 [Papaver somniferum]|nr:hypothetical protein C5167_021532 [Papaver somniferum]